jgi:hypothetical protein
MGGPDRHVMALIREKLVSFVPQIHLHQSFIRPEVRALADKKKWSVNGTQVSDSAGWNEAFLMTKERWDREGLGKVKAPATLAYSPIKPKLESKASREEEMKKDFYHLLDFASTDPSVAGEFHEFVLLMQSKRAATADQHYAQISGEDVRLPPGMGKQSSNPKASSATHRKKHKKG